MKREIIKSSMFERDYDRWLKANDYEQWLKNKKAKKAETTTLKGWIGRNRKYIVVTAIFLLYATVAIIVISEFANDIETAGGIRQIIIDLGKEIVSIVDEIKGR